MKKEGEGFLSQWRRENPATGEGNRKTQITAIARANGDGFKLIKEVFLIFEILT